MCNGGHCPRPSAFMITDRSRPGAKRETIRSQREAAKEREMATSNEKNERRRRIAEKGLNRMSQIRSTRPQLHDDDPHHQPPPSNHLDQTNDAKKESFDAGSEGARDRNALFPNDQQAPQTYHSHHISAPVGLSEASTSSYLKHDGMHQISSVNSLDVRGQSELQTPGTDKHAISALVVGARDKSQPLQKTLSLQKASSNAESLQKPCRNQPYFFSSKRLNSCIITSERTRSFCALLIAIFVLLSHIDCPLLGMNIGRPDSIIASKPLYIILLTDLTVVLGRLFLDKKVDPEEAEEEKSAGSQSNRHNWDGAVKLLERGLVVYQTIRALFIDCSIYAVVVICGLSLL